MILRQAQDVQTMKDKIIRLFESALQKQSGLGIDHLFLSALLRNKRGVSLYQGEIDSVEIADEIKLGVWLGISHRWGCSSLEQVSEEAMDRALTQTMQASRFSDPDPDHSLASPSHHPSEKSLADSEISKISMKEFEKIGHAMEGQIRKSSPLITNIPEVSVGHDSFCRILFNSAGVKLIEKNSLLKAGLSVMAEGEDKRVVNVHEMDYWKTLTDFRPQDIVAEVTSEVLSRISPRIPASGSWPILFDPRTSAQLLATFWSIFSGDMLYRKLTRLEGKLGQEIASQSLSIREAGNDQRALVPHLFDAEGIPHQDKYIVQNGIFQTFLHNRYTAKKAGVQTTGNAAGGLGDIPGISPTNIRWEGQKISRVSDLISPIKKGILVKELHGASSSPISGDFSYGTLGYWIEDGKIQYPIADFTIAGNFFELLKKISGVGNDLRFFMPHLLGSYGGRSLLVESLDVSGA